MGKRLPIFTADVQQDLTKETDTDKPHQSECLKGRIKIVPLSKLCLLVMDGSKLCLFVKLPHCQIHLRFTRVELSLLVKLPYCQYGNSYLISDGTLHSAPYKRACLKSGCAVAVLLHKFAVECI